jgi:maltose O-acetyltransferase
MTEKEKMLSGNLYILHGDELRNDMLRARKITRLFNGTTELETEYRVKLLKELFGKTGEKIHIEPPFYCDYGYNITVGESFYANFDCIILDVNKVNIGNNVFFGPRVCIYTAGHPIDADVRNTLLEYGKPIKIGNNVWIGGNTIINPGITVGNNVVIGSGSIITKDIPENVIAVGNPCKVLRLITEEDKKYWEDKKSKYYKIK